MTSIVSSMETKPHIALIPSPGISHLIPFVEFAKQFAHLHHDFHVTLVVPTLATHLKATQHILATLPSSMDSIVLPVHPPDLPQATSPEVNILQTVQVSLPYLRDVFKSMTAKSQLVAVVLDPFSIEVLKVAKEFNIPPYIFITSGATTLSLFLSARKLDETIAGDLIDEEEPIRMPGCVALHSRDLPYPILRRSSYGYRHFLHVGDQIPLIDGIIVNTFLDIEERPIQALKNGEGVDKPKIYPIGPIIQKTSSIRQEGFECLRWLDSQPHKSVLYISFGSGGTLSHDQFIQLTIGLELSGEKFIWVVRTPSQLPHGAFLGAQNEDPIGFLPKGFLERTQEKGFVIPSWAPQIEILSHESTAGFLSHCGWSSTLESIVHGVPIIALPLFAEQGMNAVLLTVGLKVALRPKVSNSGIVESVEIAKVIKNLMKGEEGKGVRERMSLLKNAASNVLTEDGTSTSALSELALNWKKFENRLEG